ncbi:MAG: hypothetical protein J0H65_11215 [Rhizobiales bacterium]|nr:hypothetical protein [Hyphomicrobiales bacterium]
MSRSPTLDDLRLVGSVLRDVLGDTRTGLIPSSALSRHLFALVEAGESDFAVLALHDNVIALASHRITGHTGVGPSRGTST